MRKLHAYIVFFILMAPLCALATQVVPPTLVELSKGADVVFYGKCTSARETTRTMHDRDISAVEYDFDVTTPIKGVTISTFRFLQFAGPVGMTPSDAQAKMGIPSYKVGEEYLLFLTGESRSGFRSPLGLTAGAFRVYANSIGEKSVMNGFGNRWLTTPSPMLRQTPANARLTKSIMDDSATFELENFIDTIDHLKDE